MSVHQLKILLKTSIPEQGELIELTSSLLPIKVKEQLNKYPYFSPSLEYPRTVIQDMRYEDRIKFFFNQGTFNKYMKKHNKKLKKEKDLGKSSNQSIDKEEGEKENEKENEKKNVEKNVNKIYGSDLCIGNFLFTIQTILPTGYTPDNHYQSIEFYGPIVRNKVVSLKGSKPGWISSLLVPRRYKRNFSHINYKGAPYTVDKVTWVNDAINHPDYNPIIESYAEGEKDKEKQDKEMSIKKEELESKIEMEYKLFVLKMLLKIEKYKVYTKETSSRGEGSKYDIRKRIENAMYKIVIKEKEKEKEVHIYDDFKFNFNTLINKLDTEFNKTKFGKLYKGVRDDKPYWLGSTLLKNEDKIKTKDK